MFLCSFGFTLITWFLSTPEENKDFWNLQYGAYVYSNNKSRLDKIAAKVFGFGYVEAPLACSRIVGILFIDEDLVEHYGSNASHRTSHRGRERQTRHVGVRPGRSWSGTRDGEWGRAIARTDPLCRRTNSYLVRLWDLKGNNKKGNLIITSVLFGWGLLSTLYQTKEIWIFALKERKSFTWRSSRSLLALSARQSHYPRWTYETFRSRFSFISTRSRKTRWT